MHFLDVVLTSTGTPPGAAFPTRTYDAPVGTYDPARSAFGEALGDSAGANSGRHCVVCCRTSPKTIFSCRYKVHEKNLVMLSDYFKRSLDCGDLCDRCYRLWYKQKRAAKTKQTAKVEPSQHQRPHHHKYKQQQQQQQQQIGPTASRRYRTIHDKFLFENRSDMLDTHQTGGARRRQQEGNPWLSLDNPVFPSLPSECGSSLVRATSPEGCSLDELHNDPSDSIATSAVESDDIVSSHDSDDQFGGGEDDDDHVVVHIRSLQRHKRRYGELEDSHSPTEDDSNSDEALVCSSPLEQSYIGEMHATSFAELMWLSRPPRKSRRKATPLRSVTRETTLSAVHVSV